jgi:hypothetical protein
VADFISHIDQARHNENCARFLVNTKPEFRDWAITATFYATVHLVEACFTTVSTIGHTETAPDRHGQEPHGYRSRKVNELAKSAYKSYRKLYTASYRVRYLAKGQQIATAYYNEAAVHHFIEIDLPEIRTVLENSFGIKLS